MNVPRVRSVRAANQVESEECEKCPAGTSSGQEEGATLCALCDNGQFQPRDGRPTCEKCLVGRSGDVNAAKGAKNDTVCIDCTPGKYQNEIGKPACKACPLGKFSAEKNVTTLAACKTCGRGKYADLWSTGATACFECPTGRYGEVEGLRFMMYTSFDSEKDAEVTYVHGDKGDPSSYSQSALPSGSPAPANAEACRFPFKTCSSELLKARANVKEHDCEACPAGKHGVGSGKTAATNCEACPAGKFSTAGQDECWSCPKGWFRETAFPAGAEGSECQKCPVGKVGETLALTRKDDCTICPVGTYNYDEGAIQCKDCEKGKSSNTSGRTDKVKCDKCMKGKYASKTGSPTCDFCPAGRYNTAPGSDSEEKCDKCDAGWYEAEPIGEDFPNVETLFGTNNGVRVKSTDEPKISKWADYEKAHKGVRVSDPDHTAGEFIRQGCYMCPAGRFNDVAGGTSLEMSCKQCSPGFFPDATDANRV